MDSISMHLPIIDLDVFCVGQGHQDDAEAVIAECKKAAHALIIYGALILHDSRVSEDDNNVFLDMLEDYFDQSSDALKRDERPELCFQVGVTLENTEKPKCAVDESCLHIIERLQPSERPLDISAHQPDPKCRFFWSMGEKPLYETQYPALNAPNVVPEEKHIRERWPSIMEKWGNAMKEAVSDLTEMLALGLDLPQKTFRDAGRYGPHLLAPTASDLVKFGKEDTILAGFHSDLNFLTIHGRSRYPGLNIWARNTGKRIPVKIPSGNHLLVQAGKQLEHMTGGLIKAGFHEVVVNKQTIEVINKRKLEQPERPLIRISSTFFWHLSSDYNLTPIPALIDQASSFRARYRENEEIVVYEPMKVGQQVSNELKHIALMT